MGRANERELRAIFGPFDAQAGTYELLSGRLTIAPVVAKDPRVMASDKSFTYSAVLQGQVLSITATGADTYRLVRVE
jgi:hypothetical protein